MNLITKAILEDLQSDLNNLKNCTNEDHLIMELYTFTSIIKKSITLINLNK
jgi:hypothetical protein